MSYLDGDELPEVMPNKVGRIDFKTGQVTDEDGNSYTLPMYRDVVRDELRAIHWEFCEGRDLSSDISNTPGRKPYFWDDWYHDFPEQLSNSGLYPSEIEAQQTEDDDADDEPTS